MKVKKQKLSLQNKMNTQRKWSLLAPVRKIMALGRKIMAFGCNVVALG